MTTMREWSYADPPCPSCGGEDIDLAEDAAGAIFHCMDCGEHFDPPADALPPCVLVGTDGNAFAVIATVSRCLKRAGKRDRATAWVEDATSSKSYDELLMKLHHYVDAH